MKRILYSLVAAMLMLCASVSASAVTITKTTGWFEAAAVEWTWESGATYTVSISSDGGSTWTQLDKELVRQYPTYGRADAVGLKAGSYKLKVTSSVSGDATTDAINVQAHDRNGFAHAGWSDGVGAYKNDGTLKANARVLYLTADNAKTVKCYVQGDKDVEYTGIQAILAAYEKGKETRPLDVRIIGTVKKADLDAVGSSAEGLQVKGKSGSNPMNITIEGIGEDATVHGFGFLVRSACSVEFRNFAIMICMDDCISLDTDNKHCWVHNMDFFYGGTGSDSDQAKGDGTVDIKGKSSHVTVSYNHFFDSGKCSLGGMKSETTDCWMTYHHNWFDHSDSRHPRIRTAFYHVYNNYFDGNAKYGVGVTCGGSSFVESNYFRNCKYPMLASKQGTDAEGDGTFSGENGGVIKAYNNKIINPKKVQYWAEDKAADGTWDAVEVTSRDASVSATAYVGGTAYNAAATTAAISAVPESAIDPVADVATIVRGEKEGRIGAGRMNGGDFKWTFNYVNQDANYDVISDLKSTLLNYKSTLVAYGDGTDAKNAGATATIDAGDGKGKTQSYGDDTPKPEYGGGSASEVEEDDMQAYLTSVSSSTATDGDFYWFNTENDVTTSSKIVGKVITLGTGCTYSSTPDVADASKWGLNLAKTNGEAIFYCSTGIPYISAKVYRTGSLKGTAYQSEDGTTWTKISDYSTKAKGTYTESFSTTGTSSSSNAKGSSSMPSTTEDETMSYPKYVKITNTAGGNLYVQGIKIYTVKDGESAITAVPATDDNNASATVTLDGTAITGQSYTKNIEFADATESYTIVVTPAISGATVTATSLAIPVEGATNTWTVAAPEKTSQAKVNVKFTVTSKDGTVSKVYSVSILRGDDPGQGGGGSDDPVTPTPGSPTDPVAPVTGNVTIQCGTTPSGYAVDNKTSLDQYTYSSSSWVQDAKLFSVASGQHTVTIPTGIKVTAITLYAVNDNNTAAKGKITEIAGQTFAVDMPSRKTGTAPASATATGLNLTGSFTFTVTYAAGVKLAIVAESTATAISDITTSAPSSSAMYTIDGRRIAAPVKGQMYIMNGKKYIAK